MRNLLKIRDIDTLLELMLLESNVQSWKGHQGDLATKLSTSRLHARGRSSTCLPGIDTILSFEA